MRHVTASRARTVIDYMNMEKIRAVIVIIVMMVVANIGAQTRASLSLLRSGTNGVASAAVSDMVIVADDVQSFNTAGNTHNMTITAATGGNSGIIVQVDWDTNNAAGVPTGGGTWAAYTSCTYSATKRISVFYNTNLTGGTTTITLDPGASSKTSGHYYEVSGMSATPEDVCAGSLVSASGAQQQTNILTNTATGMAVYLIANGASSAAAYVMTDNWVNTLDSAGVTNKESATAVILNGRGQFVGRSTNSSAGSTHNNLIVTFKSAINEASPSGNLVSGVIDWMGGVNNDAMTLAIATASSHGLGAIQTAAGTVNVISTTQTHAIGVQQTANGAQYNSISSTQSQRYEMNQEANQNTIFTMPATTKAVVSFWYYTGANEATAFQTRVNPVVISGSGSSDYASVQHQHPLIDSNPPQFVLEVHSGAANTPVNAAVNTWYQIVICYNAGGTHEGYVYDAAGNEVLHQTGAADGTINTSNFSTGNLHSNGGLGVAGNYKYIGPVTYNFTSAAACPTMP